MPAGLPAGLPWSGAIEVGNASLSIVSTTIAHNTGTAGFGGAITVAGVAQISIQDTTFHNNLGAIGGALFLSDQARAVIRSSQFRSNKASKRGGAVYATRQAQVQVVAVAGKVALCVRQHCCSSLTASSQTTLSC